MGLDLEALVHSQSELFGRISRAFENLRKTGVAKVTLGMAEARLQALESNWAKYEAQHEIILSGSFETISKLDYFKQNVQALTEEAFLTQKGQFLDLIQSFKSQAAVATVAGNTEADSVSSRTMLPRIQLPHFTGKYEDWPAFRDLFLSIIGKDTVTSPVEKLHYLKTCLKGEAESLIKNLTTTGENYPKAWKILSSYYENKRLLVRSYLSNFVSLSKMKSESANDLRKIFHSLKATVSSLESIGRPITNSEDLFVFLAVELLDPRSRREWESLISGKTEPADFGTLEQFLDRRLHTLESMAPVKVETVNKPHNMSTKSTRSHVAQKGDAKVEKKPGRCSLCAKDHFILHCDEYQKKSAQDRQQTIRDKDLCLNCLCRHGLTECASKRNCAACGERHHTSVHDACRKVESVKTSHISIPVRSIAVLLATARVRVANKFGAWQQVRALIDQGSEATMISERLTQRLRLPRTASSVTVFGVGGEKSVSAKGRVTVSLSSRTGDPIMSVAALVLPKLTVYSSKIKSSNQTWAHTQDLELADPRFHSSDPIELLLGADVYAAIIRQGLRKGESHEPIAQETSLGWILSGPVTKNTENREVHSMQCRVEEDLTDLVKRLWEQEDLPSGHKVLSKEDQECENHFAQTYSRQADGRYMVRLPVIEPVPNLADTRRTAVRLMASVERKFGQDVEFRSLYLEFMRQYAEMGHMSLTSPKLDQNKVCYLPHHGVLKESSTTTKLRVVFNGSSAVSTGDTLNKHLRIGSNLLPSLPDVLLRWRRHRYVIATDIEKMYRQINVHPEDRNLQRVLWRDDTRHEIQEYSLNTVTYGLACAPFLAIRTLLQLASDEEENWPLGAKVLRQDMYVDDVLTGGSTIAETEAIRDQLTLICRAGGFPLKKWSANDAALLASMTADDLLQKEPRWWLPGESHLTLGLRWHPLEDCFSFTVPDFKIEPVTKRSVLSLTARLFDPLGWLAPTLVRAKIWIQSTWLLGVDWDDHLPDDAARDWQKFKEELPELTAIQVPRRLSGITAGCRAEIHGFADASERAYAAVAYLRTEDRDGRTEIGLVAAKTKVAPLHQVSLPRLELCAATLLTRLVAHTRKTLGITDAPHLWSDSTVALGWIRGHSSSWKTYVANRVSEIQTTLPDAVWHHVPGVDNPADCASRGLSPSDLVTHPLWWKGPPWLRMTAETWPNSSACEAGMDLPERRVRSHAATQTEAISEPDLLARYSTLPRLLRVTAWCLRWRGRGGGDGTPDSTILRVDELQRARVTWIRLVQGIHFSAELTAVKRAESLPIRSPLRQLNPFQDDQGLLRVGGRLRHATLPFDRKHQVILPEKSLLTDLMVDSFHRQTLHGGVQMTLGALRQEYWIPRGRARVKSCILRCITCLRWRAATPQPMMGDLPADRVTPARPFLNTGVDYAGPIWLRTTKGRGHHAHKAFITVFVCFSTRAVHLDVASDYSAEAFLAALRRFISRRGLCRTLYSDCGTNFVGADAQLRALFTASNREGQRISAALADEGIRWRFNPPAAPNFGGLWEAAVKSTKHHLRRVIGEAKLTFEEMATLLAQIEACLNSRPLQALSDDPDDLVALTPGHFLIGSALKAIPEPSLKEEATSRLSRWQVIQQMRDHFWERWFREYLHALAHRPKWVKTAGNIQVGRLCLIRNETTAPTRWPLARVVELHPGNDGQVRVATLRTASTTLTRPVSKLILLPIVEEQNANS